MPNEKPFDTSRPAKTDGIGRQLDDGLAGNVGAAQGSAPETVGDRLKRIYPEHYVRIITEMNRQNGAESTAQDLSELSIPSIGYGKLQGAFLWDRTTEGWDFWAKLAERERS